MIRITPVPLAALCIVLCGLTTAAEDKKEFTHAFNLGLSLAGGNSETLQTHASWLTEGERERFGSLRLGWEGAYGESTVDEVTETTVKNIRAFANAQKTIRAKTFGSLDAVWVYDNIATIAYRFVLSPGLGLYWIRTPRAAVFTEAGPAYIWENVDNRRDDYAALRLAERARLALSETAKLWQSLEYVPKADDFRNYLLNAEVGIEAAVNSNLSLQLVFQNKYDSTPGENLKKNDFSLIAGIRLSL